MGDVNGDGTQEIVVKSGSSILVMNGKTGAKVWTSSVDSAGSSAILELADLNRDGKPEIVYCGSNLSVYARDGAGKLLWKSAKVNGASWPGTSIVTGDTNKDGYPEIYVVTQAEYKPYTGCITKLDHSGNILARSDICWYPCWGGLALADANFDGKYEVYLGDRSANSGPGGSGTPYPANPARGLSCYDADTLKTLWTRPDIPHSTPAPMLIDE
jgi:outer membrane protein assembly factor BamB